MTEPVQQHHGQLSQAAVVAEVVIAIQPAHVSSSETDAAAEIDVAATVEGVEHREVSNVRGQQICLQNAEGRYGAKQEIQVPLQRHPQSELSWR